MARATVESMTPVDELLALDPDTLDRTKHYRFVQERRENVSKYRARGYEVVLAEEHGVGLRSDSLLGEKRADGQIRVGDTILMMCDKSLYNERRRKKASLTQARLGATEKAFQENARKRGVKSLIDDEGE